MLPHAGTLMETEITLGKKKGAYHKTRAAGGGCPASPHSGRSPLSIPPTYHSGDPHACCSPNVGSTAVLLDCGVTRVQAAGCFISQTLHAVPACMDRHIDAMSQCQTAYRQTRMHWQWYHSGAHTVKHSECTVLTGAQPGDKFATLLQAPSFFTSADRSG